MGLLHKSAQTACRAVLATLLAIAALPACADEIRLKDGKKLYGVIVAYEENMFKVKTEFGYVLVEKDKIASILPTTPAAPEPEQPASAKNNAEAPKPPATAQPKTESAAATGSDAALTAASDKIVTPSTSGKSAPKDKHDKSAKANAAGGKPEAPAKSVSNEAAASSTKGNSVANTAAASNAPANNPAAVASAHLQSGATAISSAPAPPKAPEPPPIQEEVQGNIYINHTHGFRMYKAPSWQVIDDARNALPNAIVAMGTADESSLLVVGKEATKQSLDPAAVTVEKRLRDVYENYQQTSLRRTTVGGSPAVEYRYIGKADEHDWSGILVVIARGTDIFTVLGMTYADSDLIQIQENVLAKSIASLSFDAH